MQGHVIVERESKEGWVFVPHAHLRFNLIVLEEEAVVSASETHPAAWPGLVWSAHMEDKIKEECDFVREVEVPPEVIRFARYAIERNDAYNAAMRKGVEKIPEQPWYPPEFVDPEARFKIYRMIQTWIHEAGGLL